MFFEAICYAIFEHLLATGFKDKRILSFVSSYLDTIKINDWGILYLYYFV